MAPKLRLAPQQAFRRASTRSGASDGSQRRSPDDERQNDLLPSIRSSSLVNAASRIERVLTSDRCGPPWQRNGSERVANN